MKYRNSYQSPLGEMFIVSDGERLTNLGFTGEKHFDEAALSEIETGDLPIFDTTKTWLDHYFEGKKPTFVPAINPDGTPFAKRVWTYLQLVPYGATVTPNDIAGHIGVIRPLFVGNAVKRNPILLVVPCHRVIGVSGNNDEWIAGDDRKEKLLAMEAGNYEFF